MANIAPIATDPRFRHDPYRMWTPFEGMPQVGGPMGAMALSMFGGSLLPQGMMGMGLTEQNMYDRMQRQEMQKVHDDFLKQASAMDQQTYFEGLRGLARVSDTPWGPEQLQSATRMSQQMAAFGHLGVQAVGADNLDLLGGMRGLNVSMAEHMFQGGQFRLDPLTGRAGLGMDSLTKLNEDVFGEMFAGRAWRNANGMSAGEAGGLFEELQRAGMAGSGTMEELLIQTGGRSTGRGTPQLSQEDMDVIFDRAAAIGLDMGEGAGVDPRAAGRKPKLDFDELKTEDIQALREDPGVTAVLQSFDSRKVTDALKNYSGVIKAMREIFGDAGYPNAPVPELLNAMNQLTGGAATQLNAGEVETMVRSTMNLANSTGLGLEATMMMSDAANQHAMSMGLPAIFGAEALQHGLAFRGAYQQLGMGATPAWGASGISEIAMQDIALTNAAAGSSLANQMGVARRMQAAMGEGGDASPAFQQGSEAEAWSKAIAVGADTYEYKGERMSVSMNEAEFTEMMVAGSTSGMDAPTITRFLNQRDTNLEFVQADDIQDIVRRQQPREFEALLVAEAEFNAQERVESLGIAGVDSSAQRGLGTAMTAAAANRTMGLTEAQRGDRGTRLAEMQAGMQEELQMLAAGVDSEGKAYAIEGVSQAQAQSMLDRYNANPALQESIAEELWGAFEATSRDPNSGFGGRSLQDNLTLMDQRGLDRTARNQAKARADSMAQAALAPLGRSNPLRRGIQAVMDADAGDNLGTVLAESLGGIGGQEIADALSDKDQDGKSTLDRLVERRDAFETLRKEYEDADTPEERANALGRFQAAEAAYTDTLSDIGTMARRHGMRLDAIAGVDDVGNAQAATDAMMAVRKDWKDDSAAFDADPKNIERMDRAVETDRQRNNEMVAKIYADPGAMARLGRSGMSQLKKITDNQARMDYLANRYTGGDMGRLMRGDYDEDVDDATRLALNAEIFTKAKRDKQGNVTDPGGLLDQTRIAQAHLYGKLREEAELGYLTDAAGVKPVLDKITKEIPYSVYTDDTKALAGLSEKDLGDLRKQNKLDSRRGITADERTKIEKAQEEQREFMAEAIEQRDDYLMTGDEVMREGMARRMLGAGASDEDIEKRAAGLKKEDLEAYYGTDYEKMRGALDEDMESRHAFGMMMRDDERIEALEIEGGHGVTRLSDTSEIFSEVAPDAMKDEDEMQEVVIRIDGANLHITGDSIEGGGEGEIAPGGRM